MPVYKKHIMPILVASSEFDTCHLEPNNPNYFRVIINGK